MKDMTWLWRMIVGGIISVIIAVSAWSMNTIINIPKEYAAKADLAEQRKENREDHKDIMRKIDRILLKLNKQ